MAVSVQVTSPFSGHPSGARDFPAPRSVDFAQARPVLPAGQGQVSRHDSHIKG